MFKENGTYIRLLASHGILAKNFEAEAGMPLMSSEIMEPRKVMNGTFFGFFASIKICIKEGRDGTSNNRMLVAMVSRASIQLAKGMASFSRWRLKDLMASMMA